jgi:Tol biopolymer transport system component
VIAPDARGFAFVAADYSLHHVDLATRRVRRISPSGVRASSFLAFTPDGAQLLYVDMGPESRRWCAVHAFDLATSRDRVLATLRPGEQCFVKPAGNRRAVIHEWHQGRSGIRRQFLLVDLAGGPVRRLAPELEGAGNFDTSPDGRFVVFDRLREAPSMSLIRLP